MTQYESAIHELAERLQGTDASLTTSIADILTVALQELIEAEPTGRIQAEPGERTPLWTAQRPPSQAAVDPGRRCRAGHPKLRQGSFFPELLEPRRRIDKALWAVIMRTPVLTTETHGLHHSPGRDPVHVGSPTAARRRC